jgi:HPr serine kinase-like protein
MAAAALPALAPCVSETERDPTFTVELWDSGSVAIRPPAPPWDNHDGGPLGAVRGHNDDVSKTVVDPGSGTVTTCDLSDQLAVVWAASAAALSSWWRAVPLRFVLGWVLARPGRHMVHAGAVGVNGRGVLIAGRGGAGKSTLAVSCVEAGMEYVGDDYVLLTAGNPPRAHGLYGTARLDRKSLSHVPMLEPTAAFNGDRKAVLDLAALRPSRLRRSLPIEAIVVPLFSDSQRSELRRIPGAVPFRALAVSTIFQAPDGGPAAMELIGEVVRSVPSYELKIGHDLGRVPELMRLALAKEDA